MLETNQCIIERTSGLSTDGGGAVPETDNLTSLSHSEKTDENPWNILWVNSKAERSVRDNLIEKGFEAFVATREEIHTWRRGERRKIEKVLIPSIVFVRMKKEDRRIVEDTINVHSIMRDPAKRGLRSKGLEEYALVGAEEMQLFQQMLGLEDTDVQFVSADFSVGDYVRIKDFSEANGKAQIVRIFGDTNTYVGVRVSFLGCAYMKIKKSRLVKL